MFMDDSEADLPPTRTDDRYYMGVVEEDRRNITYIDKLRGNEKEEEARRQERQKRRISRRSGGANNP